MALSAARIAELAALPGARRVAVGNFLTTLGRLTQYEARGNLELDAGLYGWNEATRLAIRTGIDEADLPLTRVR